MNCYFSLCKYLISFWLASLSSFFLLPQLCLYLKSWVFLNKDLQQAQVARALGEPQADLLVTIEEVTAPRCPTALLLLTELGYLCSATWH